MTEPMLTWRTLSPAQPEDRDAAWAVLRAAPGYAVLAHGRAPAPDDVDALMDGAPPGRSAADKRIIGFVFDAARQGRTAGPLVGLAELARGYPTPAQAYLGLLLFDEAHQGHGLLPQALTIVERHAQGWGAGALRLAVLEDNRRAHRAWQREGFAELFRKPPAGMTATAIVMERALGSRAPADPMRVLCGHGFWLEPQTEGHAEAMYPLLLDSELHVYNDDQPPESLQALQQRYRKLESRRSADGLAWWLNWVIRLPGGALAGYVQATVQPDPGAQADQDDRGDHGDQAGASRAHIAYVLGRAYWGQGLATRATRCMLGELAETFRVRQLQATAALANHRSLRVLQRLGFHPGGHTDTEGDVWVWRALAPPWVATDDAR